MIDKSKTVAADRTMLALGTVSKASPKSLRVSDETTLMESLLCFAAAIAIALRDSLPLNLQYLISWFSLTVHRISQIPLHAHKR